MLTEDMDLETYIALTCKRRRVFAAYVQVRVHQGQIAYDFVAKNLASIC